MSDAGQGKIAFEVETARVLEILSKEIYDSPLALLRENIQNAYDATLMRCTLERSALPEAAIDLQVEPLRLTVTDHGIGMTEDVLRNNFWKAGSSGKKTDLARQSGVIGTFGIGAMANFGVCIRLRVETRAVGSDVTLVSTAERDKLSFSRECIDLERVKDDRGPGTTLIADLHPSNQLTEKAARVYLEPYVGFLPVRLLLNGHLISQKSYADAMPKGYRYSKEGGWKNSAGYSATVEVSLDPNGQAFAHVTGVKLQNVAVAGEMLLAQNGGQLMGLRNHFGLAPVPVSSHYQLGGYANLSILQPTAGREALSRESIGHVNHLIGLAEAAITDAIAGTDAADRNTAFQQYILSYNELDRADRVTIFVLPEDKNVALGDIPDYTKGKAVYFYGGTDPSTLQTFASEQSNLLHLSQSNPRRRLQQLYVAQRLKIAEVPDTVRVDKEYLPKELSIEEASLLARVAVTLSEDYLLPDVDVVFADISHRVPILVKEGEPLKIWLAKGSSIIRPVLSAYRTAFEVFGGFVKDFVRNNLYPKIKQYVPSSTREGTEALAKVLQRNRELYRYEQSELGDLEPLLGDYLAGEKTLAEVLTFAMSAGRPYTQTLRREQVGMAGSFEEALPDVVQSPTASEEAAQAAADRQFEAVPAIFREEVSCPLKILVTNGKHLQLNKFEMFLGLSDRLMKREGEFFRYPHTTKIIWGGHRIIYIFTEATARITLYYDIELREPIEETTASGGMFPTTTLITRDRIYVPVPSLLHSAFELVEGAKEFYVRFDTIVSPAP